MDSLTYKKILIVLSLTVFNIAVLYPAAENPWDDENSRIEDILRENRTGLSLGDQVKLADAIVKESRLHNIDSLFVLALIKTESDFNNRARSHRGAVGLMQVQPTTGESLARELKIRWEGDATLFNPSLNVKLGVYYFSTLMDTYNNSTEFALAAYNSGPTYVDGRLERGEPLPGGYGKKVFSSYKTLKERN